jgi:hypothetical protein
MVGIVAALLVRFQRERATAKVTPMAEPVFVPLDRYQPTEPPDQAAHGFWDILRKRRSVRQFSDRPVSLAAVQWILRAAGSAPSGANKQQWRFVCVQDP